MQTVSKGRKEAKFSYFRGGLVLGLPLLEQCLIVTLFRTSKTKYCRDNLARVVVTVVGQSLKCNSQMMGSVSKLPSGVRGKPKAKSKPMPISASCT